LGLSTRGDCLTPIRDYAIAAVARVLGDSAIPVDSLDTLRRLVANKYRARLEFISSDNDIERIAAEYSRFHPHLRKRLAKEFLDGRTEGITLERDPYDSVQFRYLVVVDSRGERAARAVPACRRAAPAEQLLPDFQSSVQLTPSARQACYR